MSDTAPAPRTVTRLSRSDRRRQLLTAAREVFVDQGYHAAAMDGIAERAGVSKPVLYQHFSSKLDLYLALLNESADELVRAVQQAMEITDVNKDRVRNTSEAYFSFVADSGQAYRLIFESDLRDEPAVQQVVERASEGCIEAIAQTIITDTGVDAARGRLLASGLVGLYQVSARFWLQQTDVIPRDEAVQLLSTLAWRGISRFPRSGDHPEPHEPR